MLTLEELPDATVRMLQTQIDPNAGGRYRASQVMLLLYRAAPGADMVRSPWGIVAVKYDPAAHPGQAALYPIGALTGRAEGPEVGRMLEAEAPPEKRTDWAKDPARNAALGWAIGEDWLDAPLADWGTAAFGRTKGRVQIFGTDTFPQAARKCLEAWEATGRPGDPAVPVHKPEEVEVTFHYADPTAAHPVYRDDPRHAPQTGPAPEQPVGSHRIRREDDPHPWGR
jgi:hypothetical protein